MLPKCCKGGKQFTDLFCGTIKTSMCLLTNGSLETVATSKANRDMRDADFPLD